MPPSDERPGDHDSGNSPWGGPAGGRTGRGRKRDDYGVALFRRALDELPAGPGLAHALLELSRAYNPVANAPILDFAARRRILDLAQAGQAVEARRLLEEHLEAYARRGADHPDAAPDVTWVEPPTPRRGPGCGSD